MKLLRLAFRNLLRNKRRTLLTVGAIGFGLSLMLWTVNFQNGSYQTMIRTGISSMAGHVVVQADGYQDEQEVTMHVRDAGAVATALAAEFPDGVVAPRIALGGLLTSTSTSVGAMLNGLDPEAEAKVQDLPDKIVEGTWFGGGDRDIVIGKAMADALDVELGDKLVFMGQNGTDEVQSRMFRVRGIYRTGSDSFDGRLAFAHLGAAQELLGAGDVAHQVTLHLADPQDSFEAADRAGALLGRPELEVLNWKEALPELSAMIQMDRSSGDVMMAIIGLIAAFGVLNTLLMSVLERTREFGVMLALGLNPGQIGRLVLAEGLVVGLIGALFGLALGLALSYHAVYIGIDYAAFTGNADAMEMEGIVMDSVLKGAWSPGRMAQYMAGAVVFCVGAALYPAWSISRLQPVEAMRHN